MTKMVDETFELASQRRKSSLGARRTSDASASAHEAAGRLRLVQNVSYGLFEEIRFDWHTFHTQKAINFGILKSKKSIVDQAIYYLGKYSLTTLIGIDSAKKYTSLAAEKLNVVDCCQSILEKLKVLEMFYASGTLPAEAKYDKFVASFSEVVSEDAGRTTIADKLKSAFNKQVRSLLPGRTALKAENMPQLLRSLVLTVLHYAQYWNKSVSLSGNRFRASGDFGMFVEQGINAVKRFKFPVPAQYSVEREWLVEEASGTPKEKKHTFDLSLRTARNIYELETYSHKFDIQNMRRRIGVGGGMPQPEKITQSGCAKLDFGLKYYRYAGFYARKLSDYRPWWQKLLYGLINGVLSLFYQGLDLVAALLTRDVYCNPSRQLKFEWRAGRRPKSMLLAAPGTGEVVDQNSPVRNTWSDVYNEFKKAKPEMSLGTRVGLGLRFIIDLFVINPLVGLLAGLGQGFCRIFADLSFACKEIDVLDPKEAGPFDSAYRLEKFARASSEDVFPNSFLKQRNLGYLPKNNPLAWFLFELAHYIMAVLRVVTSLLMTIPCFLGLRKFSSAGRQLKSSFLQFAVLGVETWKGITKAAHFVGSAIVGLITQRIPRVLGWLLVNQFLARLCPRFFLPKAMKVSAAWDRAAEKTSLVFQRCSGLKAAKQAIECAA